MCIQLSETPFERLLLLGYGDLNNSSATGVSGDLAGGPYFMTIVIRL
jgi:hypothetical protein